MALHFSLNYELLIPSIFPRKPLQFVSCVMTLSLVPGRTLESALTSLVATVIAACATLPMVELKVIKAPTLTTLGLNGTLDCCL